MVVKINKTPPLHIGSLVPSYKPGVYSELYNMEYKEIGLHFVSILFLIPSGTLCAAIKNKEGPVQETRYRNNYLHP